MIEQKIAEIRQILIKFICPCCNEQTTYKCNELNNAHCKYLDEAQQAILALIEQEQSKQTLHNYDVGKELQAMEDTEKMKLTREALGAAKGFIKHHQQCRLNERLLEDKNTTKVLAKIDAVLGGSHE